MVFYLFSNIFAAKTIQTQPLLSQTQPLLSQTQPLPAPAEQNAVFYVFSRIFMYFRSQDDESSERSERSERSESPCEGPTDSQKSMYRYIYIYIYIRHRALPEERVWSVACLCRQELLKEDLKEDF